MSILTERVFCVHWQAPTGKRGHGGPMPKDLAQAWAEEGNRTQPQVQHWVGWHPEASGYREEGSNGDR